MDVENVIEWIKEHWTGVIMGAFIIFFILMFVFGIYLTAIQPKEGYVIRKDYRPEYTSTEYRTISLSDGKSTRIPVQKYHSARYVIVIEGINSKGEKDTGIYDVTPTEYESIEIGDYYVKQKTSEENRW